MLSPILYFSPIHTWCTKSPMRVMMQSFAWVAELSFSGSICPLHRGEHVRSQSASWWIFSVQGNQLLWAELRSRCNTGVQGGEGITEKPCISSMHLAENADIGVRGGGGHQIMMWCINLPGWDLRMLRYIPTLQSISIHSQSQLWVFKGSVIKVFFSIRCKILLFKILVQIHFYFVYIDLYISVGYGGWWSRWEALEVIL